MKNNIIIATSIAPKDIEIQQTAVSSWHNLGCSVLSVNNPDEILLLKDHFPSVTFIEASRNAKELTEKPYIFFDDILKALESTKAEICGIVNSDIHLIANDKNVEYIHAEAKNSFIYGNRIEVQAIDSLIGEEFKWGFDYFFFDRSVISLFPNSDFCLGAPWWDLWACFIPIIKGACVKNLVDPIAYHKIHPQHWSQEVWLIFLKHFVSYLNNKDILSKLPLYFFANANSYFEQKNYKELALYIVIFIDRSSRKIIFGDVKFLDETPTIKALIKKYVESEADREARLEAINMQGNKIKNLNIQMHGIRELLKKACDELYIAGRDLSFLKEIFQTQKIDFGTEEAFMFLHSGWSHDEKLSDGNTANWALGESASLFLALPKEEPVQLTANVQSPKFPNSQMVTIKIDGKQIGTWELTGNWQWEQHSITINPDEHRPDVSIVEFAFSQYFKPENDDRQLAVLFESLVVE